MPSPSKWADSSFVNHEDKTQQSFSVFTNNKLNYVRTHDQVYSGRRTRMSHISTTVYEAIFPDIEAGDCTARWPDLRDKWGCEDLIS